MIFTKGASRTIELADDAQATLAEVMAQVPGSKEGCKAQLYALLNRLANFGTLSSPEQMRLEGDQIYGIKTKCGIRAYGWWHRKRRGVFVVSHFILKKKNKLDWRDLERAVKNREIYEGLEL